MFKISNVLMLAFFSSLLAFPLAIKAKDHPLIGIHYPPLPEGVERVVGWTISSPYTIRRVSSEGQTLFLLSRLLRRDSQGKGLYEVVNVLTLPPISKTEEVTGGSSCYIDGKEASNLIVIVKSSDKEFFTKARKAWWVENEKFNEIDVTGLRFQCENFSYGL